MAAAEAIPPAEFPPGLENHPRSTEADSSEGLENVRFASAPQMGSIAELAGPSMGLNTGLVFAGANARRAANADDGILTANEIAALKLQNVDLATLSACETA